MTDTRALAEQRREGTKLYEAIGNLVRRALARELLTPEQIDTAVWAARKEVEEAQAVLDA